MFIETERNKKWIVEGMMYIRLEFWFFRLWSSVELEWKQCRTSV